jgi:hypothetical protein
VLCRSRGDPEPPFSASLGLTATLGLVLFDVRAKWMAIVVGDPRNTQLSAALGLAAALGSALFGVHASWITVRELPSDE